MDYSDQPQPRSRVHTVNLMKRFEAVIIMIYIVSAITSVFISSGIYLLTSDLLGLNNVLSLFIASLVWVYLLMLFGLKLTRAALRPVTSMYSALEHLSVGPSDKAPPSPEVYGVSKAIVEQVIKDVYDLSVGNHDNQTQLQSSKEFAEAILNVQDNAILAVDRNRQITFANPKAINLMPETITSPIGMTLDQAYKLEFSSGDSLSVWLAQSQVDKIQNHNVWERVRITTTNSGKRYFDLTADYSKNESHGIETVVTLIDKTDSYQGDDEKLSFVSLAVHELRSPITLLRGYIEVFEDELSGALDEDQRSFMQKMTVTAGQLSVFVNNILNVARIENDQLKVHINEDTIYDAFSTSKEDFTLRAEVRSRKLTYSLEDGIGPIGLDRVAIYEVLSNLLDNAIKYSSEGGEIIIAATKTEAGGVSVSVQDFGVGIPSSSMDNLFERFYRSHHSRDKVSGTGLGLFLSKRIVEAHGGTIWVKSKSGEGSTFGFDLPSYEQIKQSDEDPEDQAKIVRSAHGWIKNHGKVRK